ncbi:MAG TPA: hypothetical protein VK815_18125 [Candidatus Acidoferrales bacterium]|jgi:hypothetical protein|nr:hypothetical protein [Candidatus Acidoferrales bacterium]
MSKALNTFTAAQIAAALGVKRQAVQWHLRDVLPAGVQIVAGNEAAAWTVDQLPASLDAVAREKGFRDAGAAVMASQALKEGGGKAGALCRCQLPSPLPLEKICDEDIQAACKLREALRPWLIDYARHDLTRGAAEQRGVQDYRRIFGHEISPRYWRELLERGRQRDNGLEQWDTLSLYLPGRVRPKVTAADVVSEALASDFNDLQKFIDGCSNPANLSEQEREGLWVLAMRKHFELIRAGACESSSSRRVREFLFARVKCLAPTSNALRMAFERRRAAWNPEQPDSIQDGRKQNGIRFNYSPKDVRRVRHSAATKNGGRIDAAWREEYNRLSAETRQRHPYSRRCPHAFLKQVNREKVDALYLLSEKGKRALRGSIGGVERSAESVKSMDRWAVDDWTSNVVVRFKNADGTESLIQPQIITVMDFASRKWVACIMSNDKGPNTRLVNTAILNGFKRHGVPRQLWLENGFVFGKSLEINGKVDEQGRTVTAGLAQYGCTVHHFDKMSPTSKGELEKSFDLVQRQMERHPGYGGRLQMTDASETFKREQRLIQSGKMDAQKCRYTFDEFVLAMRDLVKQYNSTPQYGLLDGMTPDEAFQAKARADDPPIRFDGQLEWMLVNKRELVTVEAGGVKIPRLKITVRGGELLNHIGEELWALIDREDDSMVTFMSQDYLSAFTVETCQRPAANASTMADCAVMAAELKKRSAHERAVGDELKNLRTEFGNPRVDLLNHYRLKSGGMTQAVREPESGKEPSRLVLIDPVVQSSANMMEAQREAIRAGRKVKEHKQRRASKVTQETGLSYSPDGLSNLSPEHIRKLIAATKKSI